MRKRRDKYVQKFMRNLGVCTKNVKQALTAQNFSN